MNLKYKILAVLAAGIALTACGSPGTAASTPASSAIGKNIHLYRIHEITGIAHILMPFQQLTQP